MLGEAALTSADADRYFDAYARAIGALHARAGEYADAESRPSISVKLSALHPNFDRAHRRRVLRELAPRLVDLCVGARDAGVALTLDTEESERLELTLELVEAACRVRALAGWAGFGIAVQAYQKRAQAALRYLIGLAERDAAGCCTCGSSRARTGTRRSSVPRNVAWRDTRCSRASRTRTSRTSPARR